MQAPTYDTYLRSVVVAQPRTRDVRRQGFFTGMSHFSRDSRVWHLARSGFRYQHYRTAHAGWLERHGGRHREIVRGSGVTAFRRQVAIPNKPVDQQIGHHDPKAVVRWLE